MGNLPFKKVSAQTTIIASVIVFMTLNAVLPLNFSPQAEATAYPFKLTIALEKTTYKLGEPVNITWVLTNIGAENITLYNSRDDPLDFLIRDENFIHVFRYRSYYGVLGVVYPFAPIAPGNNMIMTGIWKQIYDYEFVKIEPGFWHPRPVPPGTYYVAGVFSSATYNVILETPVIRITILGG